MLGYDSVNALSVQDGRMDVDSQGRRVARRAAWKRGPPNASMYPCRFLSVEEALRGHKERINVSIEVAGPGSM
jgi:hypothetical protein